MFDEEVLASYRISETLSRPCFETITTHYGIPYRLHIHAWLNHCA